MPKILVYNYPAEGEGEGVVRDEVWFSDAWEAFSEAASRLGDIDEWRYWIGFEPAESGLVPAAAFSESTAPDCGGVQISYIPDDAPSMDGRASLICPACRANPFR